MIRAVSLAFQTQHAAELAQINLRLFGQHLVGQAQNPGISEIQAMRPLAPLCDEDFINFRPPLRFQQLGTRLGNVEWAPYPCRLAATEPDGLLGWCFSGSFFCHQTSNCRLFSSMVSALRM